MKQVLVKPLLRFWGGLLLVYDEIYLLWSVVIIDKMSPELEVGIHFAIMYLFVKKKKKNSRFARNLSVNVGVE